MCRSICLTFEVKGQTFACKGSDVLLNITECTILSNEYNMKISLFENSCICLFTFEVFDLLLFVSAQTHNHQIAGLSATGPALG